MSEKGRRKEEEKRRVVDGRYRRKRWLKDDLVRSSLNVVVQQCLMDGPSGVEPTSRVGQRIWSLADWLIMTGRTRCRCPLSTSRLSRRSIGRFIRYVLVKPFTGRQADADQVGGRIKSRHEGIHPSARRAMTCVSCPQLATSLTSVVVVFVTTTKHSGGPP